MRWDALFSDYEAQLNAARDDQWRAEVADRTRGERSAVELAGRLSAARGKWLTFTLIDGHIFGGVLRDCAATWVLIEDEVARHHLVPSGSIAAVRGIGVVAQPLGHIDKRLDLTHTLRALSRDRVDVRARTTGGEVVGTVASVHADHIDIAEPSGTRASVPLAQLIEVVARR